MDKKKLVIGVIGADVHAVGISILQHAFEEAGFEVVDRKSTRLNSSHIL